MSYGVRTANIFDLLDSNDEDNASLEQIPQKQAPAKVKEVEKSSRDRPAFSEVTSSLQAFLHMHPNEWAPCAMSSTLL